MRRRTAHLVALFLVLAVASCNVQLSQMVLPAQALTGSMFPIRLSLQFTGTGGTAGCVLQLPNGFTIEGLASSTPEDVLIDAAPAAIYTAEPGTHLVGFSGTGAATTFTTSGSFQAFVRTTPGTLGTFPIKVALGAVSGTTWVAQDPPQTLFALINDAAHSQSISIVQAPVGDFAFDCVGLPILGGRPSHGWASAVCGDVDGDGNADIVAVDTQNGLRYLRSQPHPSPGEPGTTWVEQPGPLPQPPAAQRCALADLDDDGAIDLMPSSGTPIFRAGALWTVGATPSLRRPNFGSVAVGDIDHDGLPDVALGADTSQTLQVLLNNGDRTFRDSSTGLPDAPGQGTTRVELLLVDLDGDGNLDLFYCTSAGSLAFRGDGQGAWTPLAMPVFGRGDAVAVDIDGDGVVEIVNSQGQVVRWFGNNTLALLTGTGLDTQSGNPGASIAALDFDRDGDMDLAFTAGIPAIDILRNDGVGRFARYATTGLPDTLVPNIVDLAVGDIDGNGWPDLVATVDRTGVFAFQNLRTGAAPFGAGCGGAGVQVPTLAALGTPVRGNAAFAVRLSSSVGAVLGGFWFADAALPPLDLAQFGAPGCALLAAPTVLQLGLLDGSGHLTVPLPVPAASALTRATFFGQGCVFVPGANAAGTVLTRGLALRLD